MESYSATLLPTSGQVAATSLPVCRELRLGVSKLLLLDGQGQVVETLAATHLGLNSLVGGLRQNSFIYLRVEQNTVRTDPDLMNWELLDADAATALAVDPC